MSATLTPHLMFTGQAEEAIRLYTAVFENSGIDELDRYSAGEPGPEGGVKFARFHVCGQSLTCIDSPPVHAFTFTPSISLMVTLNSAAEVDDAFTHLAEAGTVLMPLDAYPFSPRFGWVNDKYGVSWQLRTG
jgi:predicted 3-demethylubiquinone-9 3-methyltransferase (glyoxalase superfamily)